MWLYVLAVATSVSAQLWEAERRDDQRTVNPIVFVPGIAGTGLFASTSEHERLPECGIGSHRRSRFRIWAALSELRPPRLHQACTIARLGLQLPECQQRPTADCVMDVEGPKSLYKNATGVSIEIDSPGSTKGFENLDYLYGIGVYGTGYFDTLINAFRQKGYMDGDTIFGFPYDWRLPPNQLDLMPLKAAIETAKRRTKKKVVIISHSLGSVVTNYFLNSEVDAKWKADHIHAFISLAGAFGGSPKAVRALLTGYNELLHEKVWNLFNVTLVPLELTRTLARSMGSVYHLIPSPEVYATNLPLVSIHNVTTQEIGNLAGPYNLRTHVSGFLESIRGRFRSRRYTMTGDGANTSTESTDSNTSTYAVGNWTQLLPDEKLRAAAVQASKHVPLSLMDPGVPTYCIYTNFIDPTTEMSYEYANEDLDQLPKISMTFGDKTLPLESLRWCTRWSSTVFVREILELEHMHMLRDPGFVSFLVSLVSGFSSNVAHIDTTLVSE